MNFGQNDLVTVLDGAAPSMPPREARVAGASSTLRKKSAIHVRLVEPRDWPAIRAVVRRHHERTRFNDMPFSDKKWKALEKRLRASRNECMLAAEAGGKLVGAAWASAGEFILCDDSLMTTVHLIAVDRQACGPYLAAKTFTRLMRGGRAGRSVLGGSYMSILKKI